MIFINKRKKENFNNKYKKPDVTNFYINNTEEKLIDYAFITECNDKVIAYVPVELLYTEDLENVKRKVSNLSEEKINHLLLWEDINIARFKPHRDLYLYFRGYKTSYTDYLDWYKKCNELMGIHINQTDGEIMDRLSIEYSIMTKEIEKGTDFFKDNPIEVYWNGKGYFNINDGHHRAIFLWTNGIKLIPAIMSKKDYDRYLNVIEANFVLEKIKRQKRKEFYQPLLNPFFQNIIPYRDGYYMSRLDFILKEFNNYRFKNLKILDIGANIGYFSQHFAREGAEVTSIEPDPLHSSMFEALNQLYGLNINILKAYFETHNFTENYDICILLTVFYHIVRKNGDIDLFLEKLDKHINKMIIWESGDLDIGAREKELIKKKTKFKNYKFIANTNATGKIRELGIFYTNEMKKVLDNSEVNNEQRNKKTE